MMKFAKKIFVATALTGFLAMANLGTAQAGDSSTAWKSMKPLYAVSFDVGRKHVISYFLNKNGLCDLTLMVADQFDETSDGNEMPTLTTIRFKAAINGGKTVLFDTAEGKTLEYVCAADAQAMSIRQVSQVAVALPPG